MNVRVASAGTGKTTSLVRRLLARVAEGAPLRRMAGVTFTRAAAAELRERVGAGLAEAVRTGAYLDGLDVYPPDAGPRFAEAERELDGAVLTTIHGFMAVGLRSAAPLLGLDPAFGTLPEWEAQAIFEEELHGLAYAAADASAAERGAQASADQDPALDPALRAALARLGDEAVPLALAAFAQRSLADRFEAADGDEEAAALATVAHAAYRRFQARTGGARLAPPEIERRALAQVGVPAAVARLAARTPFVLVDEFQDVNPLQGRYFRSLEAAGIEVEVVGDPKQSIYGFRHADVEVFRRAAREGAVLPPLAHSRRHAQLVVRFLNALTDRLASDGHGFVPDEAPQVAAAGDQAQVRGRVEVHWVRDAARMDALRAREATVLAERLSSAHERGRPWDQMAVLARSHHALQRVRNALTAAGIPTVLGQGRGYYERTEVRDLVQALRVGVEPDRRDALAAWARGPFGQLTPAQLDRIVRADDAVAALREAHPDRAQALDRIREAVRSGPLEAIRTLVRAPLLPGGERFVARLSRGQRENVDALLFEVAERPPGDLELLLQRMDLLSRQAREAGDVPAEGSGVALVTVHASKGLEWPLVAVFDLGARGGAGKAPRVLIQDGRLHLPSGPGHAAAAASHAERQRQESFRLLYVAASRARDELILTASVDERARAGPWAAAVARIGVGPDAAPLDRDGVTLLRHGVDGVADAAPAAPDPADPGLPTAPWTSRRFRPDALPPVESPSRIRVADGGRFSEDDAPDDVPDDVPDETRGDAPGDGEPWRAVGGDADGAGTTRPGRRLPGQAVAVGTLLHDAVRRDADPDDERQIDLLRAQEVMFPYERPQQDAMLDEVRAMLRTYHSLLGGPLPALHDRTRDLREWPVLLPDGRRTWQGVVDRLYRVGDAWYLDDYKTDRTLRPGRYAFQLAVYRKAVAEALRVRPQVRLVNLRGGEVRAVDHATLESAWRARTGPDREGTGRDGPGRASVSP
ncbi:MAG: UvrD-helicase domain-containing protein [Trueperaceae bacterium]